MKIEPKMTTPHIPAHAPPQNSFGLGNMEHLKSHVLTMFAINSNRGSNSGGNSSGEDGIFMAIWAIMLISILDAFFKYLPVIFGKIEHTAKYFIKKKFDSALPSVMYSALNKSSNFENEENSILLSRTYKTKDGGNKDNVIEYEYIDSIIEYICSLDNSKHLRYTNKFYINNKDEITINKDIKAKLETIDIDNQTNEVNFITIRLYSTTVKISTMKEQLNKIYSTYKIEKCNKLGTQRYFFNEFHIPPMPDIDGGYRYETAPKRITFNMTPFNTFKSINNIFGEHIDEVRDRVNLFVNQPEWYEKRGIPHTLGILLHGKPGCGKTSLIKAVAKDTNRHVFNITLRKTTTQRQLLNLFFDENVSITNSANETSVIAIPLDQRVYVIEDIDCMSDVVLDRKFLELLQAKKKGMRINKDELEKYVNSDDSDLDTLYSDSYSDSYCDDDNDQYNKQNNAGRNAGRNENNNGNTNVADKFKERDNLFAMYNVYNPNNNHNGQQNQNGQQNGQQKPKKPQEAKEEITLSFLLNLLDGVLETPNRILIITSNYPKRLDKALVRPGRIDINIEFTNASLKMIESMLCHFYNKTAKEIKAINISPELEQVFTPAEIIAIFCNNYKDIDNSIMEMQNKMASKMANKMANKS